MQAARLAVALPGPRALNLDDAALARSWAEGAGMALSPVGELKTGKRNDVKPKGLTLLAAKERAPGLRTGLAEAEANLRRLPLRPRPGQPAAEHPDARTSWRSARAAWPAPRACAAPCWARPRWPS